MRVIALDHLVLNVKDLDSSLRFYRDVLGLEVLREKQFRRGDVGFVSVRVSEQSIIDLRVTEAGTGGSANVDHFCLVVDESDMDRLIKEWRSRGVAARGPAGSRWGAQGRGTSFDIVDPDGNKIEIKSYPVGSGPD